MSVVPGIVPSGQKPVAAPSARASMTCGSSACDGIAAADSASAHSVRTTPSGAMLSLRLFHVISGASASKTGLPVRMSSVNAPTNW
jgi:hypothetical protein